MRVDFLGLVFLLGCGIRNVHNRTPGSGNHDLAGWPRSNMSPQAPLGLSKNPCDTTAIHNGEPDAHLACHNQCMALKSEVNFMYNMFPNHQTAQYLHEKCGMVTEGKCSTVTIFPVCWCYRQTDSEEQQRNTLANCRIGLQVINQFATAVGAMLARDSKKSTNSSKMEAVNMQNMPPARVPTGHRSPRQRRPNTSLISSCCGLGNRSDSPDDSAPILPAGQSAGPSVPPAKRQKGKASTDYSSSSSSSQSSGAEYLPEGLILFTSVRVSGRPVLAMVDSGAALCLIHPNLAVNTVPDQSQVHSIGVENNFQVLGKSTIRLGVGTGVTVPLTGYVADRGYELVLGNDFFVAWAAKIRISDRAMDLSTGLSQVRMNIQFLPAPANVGMMNLHQEGYASLTIAAKLNEIETRVVIDTGAAITIVDRNFVYKPIHQTTAGCAFGGTTSVGFVGTSKVALTIENYNLMIPAFVPTFQPDDHLLLGNDFIQQYVELIDYESKSVTLKLPSSAGTRLVVTRAFFIEGE